MPTRSILVNFNGYPSTIDSLMPDNGLANLAGSLMESGHETLILDFSTVDIIRRLVPDDMGQQLSEVYNQFLTEMRSGGRPENATVGRLLYLDKALEEHKQVELVEIADEVADAAIRIGADFVGFKLWTGDGFAGSVKIAARLRERIPHVRIFAGGPHVDWFMENILDHTDAFDVLAYGEGEETIKLLAEYSEGKRQLSDIPNLIYRENGSIRVTQSRMISDLDMLPDPVYEERVYPAMAQAQKIRFMMVDDSRGCPNACYFCVHSQKSGAKCRKREASKTVDLMEKLNRQLGIDTFRLAGSNPPVDLKMDLAREFIMRDFSVEYSAFSHVREHERVDYELLRKSGCVALAFGVESGSQRILDQDINKRITVEQISSALTKCRQAGILAVASLIVPCPHDTPETIGKTLSLLLDARPDSVTVQLPGLIPNTHWYRNRADFGFELDDGYMSRAMRYSVKLLLPPVLWEPLPYRVNGKDHSQVVMMAQHLVMELEKNGILTGIGDFLLLAGKHMDMPAREIRDANRRLFFTGNYRGVQNMVELFNRQVAISV